MHDNNRHAASAAPVETRPRRAQIGRMDLISRLGLNIPLIQAPMAGVSTPALAAAVSNAGGLGSLGLGATNAQGAASMIRTLRSATNRAFNVNLFVHAPAQPDKAREEAWLAALKPVFEDYGTEPPAALREIYKSFAVDKEMLETLLAEKPPVISFHFGLPAPEIIAALRGNGAILLASATSPEEARLIEAAGLDGVIAQGIEAGGHRGIFNQKSTDAQLGTLALTRILARQCKIPVIAAGGIMDGQSIAAALKLGAVAAQLGTAFIACSESSADAAYRQALQSQAAGQTSLTSLISGRPARVLANRFTALTDQLAGVEPPDYPIAYDVGKALNEAAKAKGDHGFGAQWAGQGAPLVRPMPAAELVELLRKELAASL